MGSDRSVHYPDCGDDSRVFTNVKVDQVACLKYMQFIMCQLYVNKVLLKMYFRTSLVAQWIRIHLSIQGT